MSTPIRHRTQRAILMAAIRVLSANRSASTSEISAAADVARSTVHRHFPDRAALVAELHRFVDEEYTRVVDSVRLDEGTGREALLRLATELVDHLDVFGWWMHAIDIEDDHDSGPERDAGSPSTDGDMADEDIDRVVARGQNDGSVDRALPAAWIHTMLWSMLYSVTALRATTGFTPGEARSFLLRSLDKAIRDD